MAQLVGAFAFEGARRLIREVAGQPLQRPLSDRQRDRIYWVARGKLDREIPGICGISRDTAIQHLKQARQHYGVFRLTQLTVHACSMGA